MLKNRLYIISFSPFYLLLNSKIVNPCSLFHLIKYKQNFYQQKTLIYSLVLYDKEIYNEFVN